MLNFARATLAAASLLLLVSTDAIAKDYNVGTIKISMPWTRVTPAASTVAGGFMTITNTGTAPDTLIGGTAAISARLEVH